MRMVQPKGPQRERVLEAAARVYYEKGFATATMQDIADRVGILKGSLYYYVESKDALLVEIVERAHDGAWPVMTATADGSVAELIGRYARWAVGAPVAAALMLERHPGGAAAPAPTHNSPPTASSASSPRPPGRRRSTRAALDGSERSPPERSPRRHGMRRSRSAPE
jgi:AcrR family transcriptional regulator